MYAGTVQCMPVQGVQLKGVQLQYMQLQGVQLKGVQVQCMQVQGVQLWVFSYRMGVHVTPQILIHRPQNVKVIHNILLMNGASSILDIYVSILLWCLQLLAPSHVWFAATHITIASRHHNS